MPWLWDNVVALSDRFGAHVLFLIQVHPSLQFFSVEVLVDNFSHISREHTEVPGHDGCPNISSSLQEALTSGWELRGVLSLGVWIIVHFREVSGGKDQSGHLQASWHDKVSVHHPHIELP